MMGKKKKRAKGEAPRRFPWWIKLLAGMGLTAIGFFYISDPEIRMATLGDRLPNPVPIAYGNQLLPFTLTTTSGFLIDIRELRVSYDPTQIMLIPNPKFRTEIAPADDGESVESIVFREPFSINKDAGVLTAIRYVAKESSNPFRLKFIARAKISDWDIGFLGRYFPVREWRITHDRIFAPIGMPILSSQEKLQEYFLDTRILGSRCKKYGEATEVAFSPDTCANINTPQIEFEMVENRSGRTLQAGERILINRKKKTFIVDKRYQ